MYKTYHAIIILTSYIQKRIKTVCTIFEGLVLLRIGSIQKVANIIDDQDPKTYLHTLENTVTITFIVP